MHTISPSPTSTQLLCTPSASCRMRVWSRPGDLYTVDHDLKCCKCPINSRTNCCRQRFDHFGRNIATWTIRCDRSHVATRVLHHFHWNTWSSHAFVTMSLFARESYYPLGLCFSIFFIVVIRNFPIPLRLLLPYFSVLSSFAIYQQLFLGSPS